MRTAFAAAKGITYWQEKNHATILILKKNEPPQR
jgi:hypothetical protein